MYQLQWANVLLTQVTSLFLNVTEKIGFHLEDYGKSLVSDVAPGLNDTLLELRGHFIGEKHTRENFTNQHYLPSPLISRLTTETWQREGCKDILERAKEKVKDILEKHSGFPLLEEKEKMLDKTFIEILKKYGIGQEEIPWGF